MNKKTTLKLRKMASQAAINCLPVQVANNPEKRRRFELNVGLRTYEKLKERWYTFSNPEKKKLNQGFVDSMARLIAFPVKATKEPRKKTKPRTKNRAKTAARAKVKAA